MLARTAVLPVHFLLIPTYLWQPLGTWGGVIFQKRMFLFWLSSEIGLLLFEYSIVS